MVGGSKGGKWLSGVVPTAPAQAAAHWAVANRWRVLAHYLPRAARQSRRDVEYVHQLRVATRRLQAATEMFEPLLPARRARQLDQFLRQVRQAAGTARDLDVLLGRLGRLPQPAERSTARKLRRRLRAARRGAQRPIEEAYRRAKRRRLPRKVRKLLAKLEKPASGGLTYHDFSRQQMQAGLARFWEAERDAAQDLESLHAVRVAGKQLRYAMELFAGAFDSSLREQLYAPVEQMQEQLGKLNDHAVAASWFSKLADEGVSGKLAAYLAELLAHEQSACEAQRQAFLAQWAAEGRGEFERAWQDFMAERGAGAGDVPPAGEGAGKLGGPPGAPTAAAPER